MFDRSRLPIFPIHYLFILRKITDLAFVFQLSSKIACSDRHLVGGLCVGICRDVLDAVTEHCSMRHQSGQPLAHYGSVQRRLARAAAHLYAMESMTYLVAGYLNEQPQRDLRIESSAVKVSGELLVLQTVVSYFYTTFFPFLFISSSQLRRH